jgi:hypothetical protein
MENLTASSPTPRSTVYRTPVGSRAMNDEASCRLASAELTLLGQHHPTLSGG